MEGKSCKTKPLPTKIAAKEGKVYCLFPQCSLSYVVLLTQGTQGIYYQTLNQNTCFSKVNFLINTLEVANLKIQVS